MIGILMISAESSPHQSKPSGTTMLARTLAGQGHRVVLLSDSGSAEKNGHAAILSRLLPAKLEVNHITWVFPPVFRTRFASGWLKVLQAVVSILSTFTFGIVFLLPDMRTVEVVYASTVESHGFIGVLLKAVFSRPLVVSYGDPSFVRDVGVVRSIQRVFERITLARSDLVLANDPVIAEWVSRQCGRKVIFMPNGYDDDLFRNAAAGVEMSSDFKIITFVGKVDLSVYRLDILLNALKILLDRVHNVRLRVIGDGPGMTSMKRLAKQLRIEACVEFVGLVPHEDVPKWLSESDVCVHVSNDTCLGNKVLEYMAAKRPVVIAAPWWNRYDQFLENGVNCVMVPLDAEELATALLNLLSSPATAQTLSMNGFRTASPWTWENVSRERIILIERLSDRTVPKPGLSNCVC
jgi:glycosyltransferase involved in cell wall biosynthesis